MNNMGQISVKTPERNPGKFNHPGKSDTHVYVQSPIKLHLKTRPISRKNFNPVAEAEKQLQATARNFDDWVQNDRKNLHAVWKKFTEDPREHSAILALNEAVHVIKGNAPMLGREGAGVLASSLAALLERCIDHNRVISVIALTVNAICTAIEDNLPSSDKTLGDITLQLDQMNAKCVQFKAQAADGSSACTRSSVCKAKR